MQDRFFGGKHSRKEGVTLSNRNQWLLLPELKVRGSSGVTFGSSLGVNDREKLRMRSSHDVTPGQYSGKKELGSYN
jgi:hypothetical protein